MRKLLLVRGPQGSGKSTLIRRLGLDPFALSLDLWRRALASPALNSEGKWGIAAEFDDQVVHWHRKTLEERMRRGEFLVVEQAVMLKDDLDTYQAWAKTYRYDLCLLDLSNIPLDQALAQNAGREELLRVPEHAVRRTYGRLKDSPVPEGLAVIPWSDHLEADLQAWMAWPIVDLSAYDEIVHIGDLQGCYSVLAGPGGPLERGLDPRKFYIFVGDLLDRGLENGEVMRWFLDHVYGRSNAVLMFGNHEVHLERWARGEPPVSEEFRRATLPQLFRAGLTPADAERLVAFSQDLFCYTYRGGDRVLVTHAGLPTVPQPLEQLPAYQAYKGTGNWSDPIDERFDRNAPPGWVQVHGHRNQGSQPIQASPRSFNLEDAVEHGGHLRMVRLNAQGWFPESYPNRVFAPYRARHIRDEQRALEPHWMKTDAPTRLPEDLLQAMRDHSGVRESRSQSHPHIAALNFTRNVFWEKSWDDLLVKARGLFFNVETGEVVARAYDKFFNLEERPETKLEAVLENAKFPIVGYRKDNGFLGLIGYDRHHDRLFFTSKSTPDSEFAEWFKTIYESRTTPAQREALRRYLRDMDCCAAFEVIDPVNDPHLIDYPEATVTLLDVFHRGADIQRLPFDQLEAFGEKMGVPVKTREIIFKNAEQMRGWYSHAAQNLAYRHRQQDLEGFVLEDGEGFMVKIKLPHYAFWKRLRSAKDRLGVLRRVADEKKSRNQMSLEKIEGIVDRYPDPAARAFLKWTLVQPPADLNESMAALQARFAGSELGRGHELAPEMWDKVERVKARVIELRAQAEVPQAEGYDGVEGMAIEALIQRQDHPLAQAFLRWTLTLPTQDMKQNILELRRAFKSSSAFDPEQERIPWVAVYDSEDDADPEDLEMSADALVSALVPASDSPAPAPVSAPVARASRPRVR